MNLNLTRNFELFGSFQGSDPRAATCRGKLQSRRCKLNQEINKELRLRAGAENLYKVITQTHVGYIDNNRLYIDYSHFLGHNKSQAARHCRPRAEFRQFKSAAAQGTAGRA